MEPFSGDIEGQTQENINFRKVIFTGEHSQLVLMNLRPGEEIGMEVHPHVDQFFRFESGEGKAIINGKEYPLKDGVAVVVPSGAEHNIVNTGASDLKLYTIYSPANHPAGTIHPTKADAMAAEVAEHAV